MIFWVGWKVTWKVRYHVDRQSMSNLISNDIMAPRMNSFISGGKTGKYSLVWVQTSTKVGHSYYYSYQNTKHGEWG